MHPEPSAIPSADLRIYSIFGFFRRWLFKELLSLLSLRKLIRDFEAKAIY
jgi:hypothetical protein